VKIIITRHDWEAICSLVDLALQSVADAEYDYKTSTGKTRRNGGYSSDRRQWEKCETRVSKQIFKEYKKDNIDPD